MPYVLQAGLSCCQVGERYVFLDLRADRYFCLTAEAEQEFQRSWQRADHATGGPDAGTTPGPPSRSLLEARHARAKVPSLIAMAGRLAGASLELRLRGLAATLDRVKRRRDAVGAKQRCDDPLPIVASFHMCCRLLDLRERCLVHSLAVMHRMIDGGMAPSLVLGVKLAPFEAHAWVQWGDAVVNDRVETTSRFTPILVL